MCTESFYWKHLNSQKAPFGRTLPLKKKTKNQQTKTNLQSQHNTNYITSSLAESLRKTIYMLGNFKSKVYSVNRANCTTQLLNWYLLIHSWKLELARDISIWRYTGQQLKIIKKLSKNLTVGLFKRLDSSRNPGFCSLESRLTLEQSQARAI